ncbi:MAG TPA: helix-turn-helix domain-containing protein [Gemmatimonadaceae bacterium]|nr:helix-turn-helix domain-containing protein [Gemmatimonadaceae bacterium]
MNPREGYEVRDAKQIRVLGSPVRQAIIDALAAHGPSTVVELAELIGKPADRLYYHLRRLEKALLVNAVNGGRGSGRRDTKFDVAGRPMFLRYDTTNAANRRAVRAVTDSLWRAARRDFTRALSKTDVIPRGKHRNIWSARLQGLLDADDVAALNEHIGQIIALFLQQRRPTRTARTLLQFTWSLSPSGPA